MSAMQPKPLIRFPLAKSRVHEGCGASAFEFAVISAAQNHARVLWIRQEWKSDLLHPVGLLSYCDPSKILLAQVKNQVEGLAVMEEALRDGSVSLVIIELDQPLDLTAGRRLQLAAKNGGATGLCIIPEGMGSNAAETRWHCDPVFDPERADSTLMRWCLIKNKSGTLCDWYVRWDATKSNPADRIVVVSPPGE